MTEIYFWQSIFAGVIVACVAINALALLTSGARRSIILSGFVFFIGVLLLGIEDIVERSTFAPTQFHISGIASVVAILGLWTFSFRFFGITLYGARLAALSFTLTALYLVSHAMPTWHFYLMLTLNCLVIAISVITVLSVIKSRPDDLDETRRQLRNPFIALIGSWTAIAAILGSLAGFGRIPNNLALLDEAGLAFVVLCATGLFTQARIDLFPKSPPASSLLRLKIPENDTLPSILDQAMMEDQLWRDENLSLGQLSTRLGASEKRLRAIIHHRMGFRNFSSFVNEYRISEAKRRLASEDYKHENIASIAYASGFGSLGPFNRAFKVDTGLTPTAYRAQMKK